MTSGVRDGWVSLVVVGAAHLGTLKAIRQQVDAVAERCAVEVIRGWMLAYDRSWLAVDFTKTRPDPPFADDQNLVAAVSSLPRRAFGCGLDLRGSFIVRLEALNEILGLDYDDRTTLPAGSLEVDRSGDGDAALVVPGAVWSAFLEQEMQLDREHPGDVTLAAVVGEIRRLMAAHSEAADPAA
ncbi:MAG: hypothetical protein WCE30_05315 [Mycobacterium sp.]